MTIRRLRRAGKRTTRWSRTNVDTTFASQGSSDLSMMNLNASQTIFGRQQRHGKQWRSIDPGCRTLSHRAYFRGILLCAEIGGGVGCQVGSPYGLLDSAKWMLRYAHPSMRCHPSLTAMPAAWQADPAPAGPTVRIAFLGDLMATARDRRLTVQPELRARVRGADLVVLNCESPVEDRTSISILVFIMSQTQFEQRLGALGIDPERCLASIANNHVQDLGIARCEAFAERLERLGIRVLGIRAGGRAPLQSITLHGLHLGFAAWTEWMNRGRRDPWAVWPSEGAEEALAAARSDAASDALIGFPHWDYEFCHGPSTATVTRARELLDAGFTLLVGHHPHVLQPIERRVDRVCAYSLGNVTPMPRGLIHWATRLGALLEVEIARTASGSAVVTAYRLSPFFQMRSRTAIDLVEVPRLPPRPRRRMEERLATIYPETLPSAEIFEGMDGLCRIADGGRRG
jgi:poly-gamma-glutamate synthesis protein (capsule biosynthesis protein)